MATRAKRRHMKINGLPVKDGKTNIALLVTSGDIKKAVPKDQTLCAAAIACKRSLGCTEARVHIGRTYLRFNGHWERYHTSPSLRNEVIAFDRGGKFEPGEYYLMKMQKSKATGKRQGSTKPNVGKSKRMKYHTLTNIRPMGLTA